MDPHNASHLDAYSHLIMQTSPIKLVGIPLLQPRLWLIDPTVTGQVAPTSPMNLSSHLTFFQNTTNVRILAKT